MAWYRILRWVGRITVLIFHRKVGVEHRERVPATGALILAANHPNMMLDVLLLATSQPRRLHFLAKSTLFETPVLKWLLDRAGALPVYRRGESRGGTVQNASTFEACQRLIGDGGALAIFPEGVSHAEEKVLPLKTGCARIVLEAEAQHGFGLGSLVVPVGIAFSSRELFRSDAHIVYGEPIDPSPYFEPYRNGDPSEAVRGLTEEVSRGLKRVARHVPEQDDLPLLATLRQFVARAEPDVGAELRADRQLVASIHHFRDRHPIDYARLRRRVLAYGNVLCVLDITDGDFGRSYRFRRVLRYAAPRVALAVCGLVPFLAGLVTHYLPYKIPAWLVRGDRHPVERGTLKLVAGLVVFPLFYALQSLLVAQSFGPLTALIFAGLLPCLGLFSLFYVETLTGFFRETRVFFLRHRMAALERWRHELLEELKRHHHEYETAAHIEP